MAKPRKEAVLPAVDRQRYGQRFPHEPKRVAITFPEQGRTIQADKDACDVNKIVDHFTRTGVLLSQAKGEPQYGEAPDIGYFEAQCAVAEAASAAEEGKLNPETGSGPDSDEKALQGESDAQSDPSKDDSDGTKNPDSGVDTAATPDEGGQA